MVVIFLAIYDSNVGIINIFKEYDHNLNYYVDNCYSSYGVYGHEEIKIRAKKVYEFLKEEKRIIVSDLDAAGILYKNKNIFYGEDSIKRILKDKNILMLTSKNLKENNFIANIVDANFQTLDVTYLINASLCFAGDLVVEEILRQYLEGINLSSYDLIFFAASPLHLYRDLFKKVLNKYRILTNIDPILMDYTYIKENILRDYFYLTGSKRDFYLLAENYLRAKKRLKKEEILNISTWSM